VAEVDIPTNVLAAGGLVFGAFTGAVAYVWKGKQKEIDDLRADLKAAQTKYENILLTMATSEPQRAQALEAMARALAENTAIVRERIPRL
jgi:acyl transferase domain-containing protein